MRHSNGTEFEQWKEAWCDTCVRDADESCPVVNDALMGDHPTAWGRGPHWSPQTVIYCKEYSPCRKEQR
jgi:hypothetical protein